MSADLLLDHWRPFCGAELFPLPQPVMVIEAGFSSQFVLRWKDPVQGPHSPVCACGPHPDSPWHWDGRGTWWR